MRSGVRTFMHLDEAWGRQSKSQRLLRGGQNPPVSNRDAVSPLPCGNGCRRKRGLEHRRYTGCATQRLNQGRNALHAQHIAHSAQGLSTHNCSLSRAKRSAHDGNGRKTQESAGCGWLFNRCFSRQSPPMGRIDVPQPRKRGPEHPSGGCGEVCGGLRRGTRLSYVWRAGARYRACPARRRGSRNGD
jgi:hypothetical protein